MAALDLEEQEQLSELKVWWQRYGNLVTSVAVAAAVASLGWQGWNWYQRSQSFQASDVFGVVQKAVGDKDAKRAREAAGELIDKYARSSQAGMGALLSAKAQADAGDLKTAKSQLAWAADNAKDDALRDLARLRLAALLLDEKAFDEALKQLDKEPLAPFAARFAELKGDILLAQNKKAESRAAYKAALEKLKAEPAEGKPAQMAQRDAQYKDVLTTKLESLGEAP